jgi:ribonuclease G
VQVIKDPIGTKGARLSTQVSLAGRLLVYLPQDSHIGISQRIEDEAEREILRVKLTQLLPEGMVGGFIIRTMAETASDREMQNDIEYLTKLWRDLNQRGREVPAPELLYQDLSLAQRVLRDMATEETARVVVDSRETFVRMQDFAREYTPALQERITHYSGERRCSTSTRSRTRSRSARPPRGSQVRRLSHHRPDRGDDHDRRQHRGFVGGRSFDDTIFKTNLEAAQVIARQLQAAQSRRHHHHRLHRHGARPSIAPRCCRAEPRTRQRPHRAHRERLHAAGPRRDDAQAHARIARARAVRACLTCTAAASSRPRRRSATRSCARSCARRSSSTRASSACLASQSVIDLFLDEESQSLAQLGRLHRQADLAAGGVDLHAGAVRHRADLAGYCMEDRRLASARRERTAIAVGRLWASTRDYFARLFRRKPPEPGRFETDSRSSIRGHGDTRAVDLAVARVHRLLPRGHSRWRRVPLVVLIHGCRQTADEIAHATRITGLADEMGCIVLLPHPAPRANAWGAGTGSIGATAAGRGETAIVLAQSAGRTAQVPDPPAAGLCGRTFLGCRRSRQCSASGSLLRLPGVIAHLRHRLRCSIGATRSARCSKHGADTDVVEIARHARANSNPDSLPVPLLVIPGRSRRRRRSGQCRTARRQYLTLNGHPAADTGDRNALPLPDRSVVAPVDSRTVTTSEWSVAGRLVARQRPDR